MLLPDAGAAGLLLRLVALCAIVPLLVGARAVSPGELRALVEMARAALASATRLDRGEGDAAFHRAKIMTARFYASHVLCQSSALAHAILHGAPTISAMPDAAF